MLAVVNLLRDYPMQRRFMGCPILKATDLLLQERVRRAAVSVLSEAAELGSATTAEVILVADSRPVAVAVPATDTAATSAGAVARHESAIRSALRRSNCTFRPLKLS